MEEILSKLSEDQAQIAVEIAQKAKQMGIDPRLAVALAYRESRLNPQAKGTSGEIGLMQVMPATAKGMGFTPEELRDPSKNIEIGLTYLKQGLDKFKDPMLAVAGYNAGHNHPYFEDPDNKSLPESTKEYLKGINSLGGFTETKSEEPVPEPVVEPASEEDFVANKARMAANLMGAGAGAALATGLNVAKNVGDTGAAIRQLPGALAAAQAGSMQPLSAAQAPQGASTARPVVGGPAGPVGGPAVSQAPLQQMGGSGTANYGKAFGLTDIEANRALDMTKNPGGANDLINQRRQAMQKIQQMGGGFVENPNYGGIMTPQQSGGGPRASFVQTPGGLSQLPPTLPVSAMLPPSPPPSGPGPLSQAAGALKQGAGAVMRSPLAMGALGGLSLADSAQEVQKRMQSDDATGAAIAGAGGIGGAMQMMPNNKLRALGAAVSAISPLTQYLRDKIRSQPDGPDLTKEKMLEAQRPAFRYARP